MIIRKHLFLLLIIMLSTTALAQSKRQIEHQLEIAQENIKRLESEASDMRARLEKANASLSKALENNASQMDINAVLTSTNSDLLNRINSEKRRSSSADRKIDSLSRMVSLLQLDSQIIVNPRSKQDSIISILQPFYAARIWEDRMDYILESKDLKPAMIAHYDQYPVRALIKPEQVTFLEADSLDTSLQKVGIGSNIIYMRKTGKTYKMDWAATHGLNQMNPILFKDTKSIEPKEFRVIANLSNTYLAPYANKKQDYWSLELNTIFPKESFNAYVLKDSNQGRAIHALLDGGKTQRIMVNLVKDQEDKTGKVVLITEFIQEDWSKNKSLVEIVD